MLLIIQNDPEVPAGNFNRTLTGLEIPCRTIHPYAGDTIPQTAEVSAAIVLGGAMGVHDTAKHPFLVEVRGFIGDCVRMGTPFLGICLGGQLLADMLGGRVTSLSPFAEKGTSTVILTGAGDRDPLFSGIPHEFVSFQWHNDSFEIPVGGTHLAFSTACPGQAFRFGPSAWGTQFHPEADRAIVDSWARWTDDTAHRAGELLDDFVRSETAYLEVSRRLLCNFLRFSGFRAPIE
jgi:GMP synthase (glutamine-hydrolysing)